MCPIILAITDKVAKVGFEGLICLFGLAVCPGMPSCQRCRLDLQQVLNLLPKFGKKE
jgi:hypothetical protein